MSKWTADDLPDPHRIYGGLRSRGALGVTLDYIYTALDEVLNQLNTHHPKPAIDGYCTCNGIDAGGLMGDCGVAAHRAEWKLRRAERDRDEAIGYRHRAEDERDDEAAAGLLWSTRAAENAIKYANAARERDAAVARAEKADRELEGEKRQHSETIRVTGEQYVALKCERDEAVLRAEVAERDQFAAVRGAERAEADLVRMSERALDWKSRAEAAEARLAVAREEWATADSFGDADTCCGYDARESVDDGTRPVVRRYVTDWELVSEEKP